MIRGFVTLSKNSTPIRNRFKLPWQTYQYCLKVRYTSNNVTNCNHINGQISGTIFNGSNNRDINYSAFTLGVVVTLSTVYFIIPKNTDKKTVETELIENKVIKAGDNTGIDNYDKNRNDNPHLQKPIIVKDNKINIPSNVVTGKTLQSNHINGNRYGTKVEYKGKESNSSDCIGGGMIEFQFHNDIEITKDEGDNVEVEEIIVPEDINLVNPYRVDLHHVSQDDDIIFDKTLPVIEEADLNNNEDKLETFELSSEDVDSNSDFYNDASHKTIRTDKETYPAESWPIEINICADDTLLSGSKDLGESTNITELSVKCDFETNNSSDLDNRPVSNSKGEIFTAFRNNEEIVDKELNDVNSVHSVDESEGGEQQLRQQDAYDPDTGEINWDCPCLGGMAQGPCGEEFKLAFSCFVYSENGPKGNECLKQFRVMEECFEKNHRYYSNDNSGIKESSVSVSNNSTTV